MSISNLGRHVAFALMGLVILIEIACTIIYIMILFDTLGLEGDTELINYYYFMNLLYSSLCLALEVVAMSIVVIFGIHSLYFKVPQRLVWFIICSLVIPLLIWILYLVDFLNDRTHDMKTLIPYGMLRVMDLKQIIFILSFIKSGFYFSSAFVTIYQRKMILKELNQSPLACIDETLTEEIYKNIIDQSKNPDDNTLKTEYKRLTINRKISQRSKSGDITLDSSKSFIRNSSSINTGPFDNANKSEKSSKLFN
jgi:hypothetical protein